MENENKPGKYEIFIYCQHTFKSVKWGEHLCQIVLPWEDFIL